MTKTASRNIAFKAAKMSETAFETQSAFILLGVGEHKSSEDLRRNAYLYLYIFNREVVQS